MWAPEGQTRGIEIRRVNLFCKLKIHNRCKIVYVFEILRYTVDICRNSYTRRSQFYINPYKIFIRVMDDPSSKLISAM